MSNTRDDIIRATCTLLEVQGYHATGLNQILKASNTPKGSLYYHFPGGKEELAAEAIAQVGQVVLKNIAANLARLDDPADSIQGFIEYIAYNVALTDFQAGGPITTVALEAASTSERLRTTCQQIYNHWQDAFATKLKASGFEDARAERIAALIIAAIEGGVILCRTSRSRTPLDEVAQEIGTLIRLAR